MHALGYNHLAPESGQNSVMVVGSPMVGDDYYSTGDVVLIQERYCGTSLQRINIEYKRTLQCESTFHNGTRLNFYDRFCDGVADCEDGEDEESLTPGWETTSGRLSGNIPFSSFPIPILANRPH